MDEILIEDKKYVSSKRASKITGYAKDYIGQLCREGRVPARLIGRSWYVLESAIQDHRFGEERSTEEIQQFQAPTGVSPTWEPPRYEASPTDDMFPSVKRAQAASVPANTAPEETSPQATEELHDSWRAWFERSTNIDSLVTPTSNQPTTENAQKEAEERPEMEEGEVNIPIHTLYELPPEDLLPHNLKKKSPIESQTERKQKKSPIIQVIAGTFAIATVILAVLNSGYLDTYIASLQNKNIGALSGVQIYNK